MIIIVEYSMQQILDKTYSVQLPSCLLVCLQWFHVFELLLGFELHVLSGSA